MTFKVIRGQGQGQEMTSVPYRDYFYPLLNYCVKGVLIGAGLEKYLLGDRTRNSPSAVKGKVPKNPEAEAL